MGESHTVIPIRSIPRDERTIGYFRDQGFELPDPPSTAREPTPNDVRAVVNALADYEVTYAQRGDSLYIDLVNRAIASSPGHQGRRGGGDWAVIWIRNYHGSVSEDLPCELYFHRGSKELVERMVGGLAKRCGPFIVMINNETPLLITEQQGGPDGPYRWMYRRSRKKLLDGMYLKAMAGSTGQVWQLSSLALGMAYGRRWDAFETWRQVKTIEFDEQSAGLLHQTRLFY